MKGSIKATSIALCAVGIMLMHSRPGSAQLKVDRATGALTLSWDAADQINGYVISSSNKLLDPTTWNSLSDQKVTGWVEANPRTEMLAELNPFGSGGSQWNLGKGYGGLTAGLSKEDLTLQYSKRDGTITNGTVEYLGPINDLVLRVNPTSGAANLELLSANVGSFDVTGFSIYSTSGSLNPSNLLSIGDGWTLAQPQATALAQLRFNGAKTFSVNSTANLGNIFKAGGTRDLAFEYATRDGRLLQGSVTYAQASAVGDCNGDGVINGADLACACASGLLDAILAAKGYVKGDLDGNGSVAFSDFLVMSANFGAAGNYSQGDIDCNGTVAFPDFLILSANFGQSGGGTAASVPEPTTPLMAMTGGVLVAALRRRRSSRFALAGLLGLALFATPSTSLWAVDFDARMVLLDKANPGANPTIDSATEARGIMNGTVKNVKIATDATEKVTYLDFAGGAGHYQEDSPYPDGTDNESLDDFAVQVKGFLEIPAGNWTIGFNSDDGGYISLPRVSFIATSNESGTTKANDGEILFDPPRGSGTWTYGHFRVPAGQKVRTEFETLMFERGGGDLFEVGVLNSLAADNSEFTSDSFPLSDGQYGWKVLTAGPKQGDINWDDKIDFADFLVLANNFGTGSSFAQGDLNGDAKVDLMDFVQLRPLLTPPAAAASAVPEPASFALLGLGSVLLMASRRRRA